VDEHTSSVHLSTLAQIERGELTEELPVASASSRTGVNRKVLYVALLLHDIGKGRPEDHSILGAQIARKRGAAAGPVQGGMRNRRMAGALSPADVRHAQKRDLPIRAPCATSPSREDQEAARPADRAHGLRHPRRRSRHLEQLEGRSCCARSTARPPPRWKTGMEALNRENRGVEAAPRCARRCRTGPPPICAPRSGATTTLLAGAADRGACGLCPAPARSHEDDPGAIASTCTPDEDRDATRVCFALADHPGIFARLAGALALVGANVVDARTYTTKDGYVDGDASGCRMRRRALRGRAPAPPAPDDRKTLKGEVVATEALKPKDKLKKRDSAVPLPDRDHLRQ
jgi:[protein-PII] uridylyltransferase